ncbi:MAG: hypothetical protein K2H64_12755 [Desulfovibrio sp.]|nr:hypothetical protein [Desulfovibrio sp.]
MSGLASLYHKVADTTGKFLSFGNNDEADNEIKSPARKTPATASPIERTAPVTEEKPDSGLAESIKTSPRTAPEKVDASTDNSFSRTTAAQNMEGASALATASTSVENTARETAPAEAEENPAPEPVREAESFASYLTTFAESAAVIFRLLKNDARLAKILPEQISAPTEESGLLVVRLSLVASPLKLRLRFDPAQRMLDAGWAGNAGDGVISRCRKKGRRLGKEKGASFSLNEDTGVFVVFREEKVEKMAEPENPDAFARKLAALCEPTRQMYQSLVG